MFQISKDAMKYACELSLHSELEKMYKLNMDSIMYQTLSSENVNQLARKIGLLPLEYRSILFLRYCFNSTSSEIEKVLETENVISKLRYIQKMLSSFMGLGDLWIDENSMIRACNIALTEDIKDYDNIKVLHKPNYSKSFRRKLKDIKIKQNHNKMAILIAKRVAIFALISLLTFSVVLAVNVEARKRTFDWVKV
ncbi:hypothetical protein [Defluviitalea phaphyphila]|uniref:hypothetical protein n=1 Tax=Defluviitalea phaphyphila TaxID=1473580 RepID=UPI000731E040|nr:hypothetical protein [Defluviitalea phaphyphila]